MVKLRSAFPDQTRGLNEVVRSAGVGKGRARRLLDRLIAVRTAEPTEGGAVTTELTRADDAEIELVETDRFGKPVDPPDEPRTRR